MGMLLSSFCLTTATVLSLPLYASFWVTDVFKLNPHFGNEEDLKALSKALHDRGM